MARVEEMLAAIAADRAAAEERRARRKAKHDFYHSRAWRALRYAALKANAARNNGVVRCEVCSRGKPEGVVIHVDHIEPLSKNWDRRLDPSNVQCACADCNLGKSNTDAIDWRPAEAAALEDKRGLRRAA